MSLQSSILRPSDLPPHFARAWSDFQEADPHLGSAFLSWEFSCAVDRSWRHARVCVLTSSGRPVAFLPFQFASRLHSLAGAAERIGGEMNDCFGLIAEPGFQIQPDELMRHAGLASLCFTHLPDQQLTSGLTGERPERGLRIVLDGGPADYWSELGRRHKDLITDTERRRKQLETRVGPIRMSSGTIREEDLAFLIQRKREQYRRTGVRDALGAPHHRRLLTELAACQSKNLRGVLTTLTAGDRWMASHFGIQRAGTLHYCFPVYDAEMSRYSPGRLLLREIIQHSPELGIRVIDRGIGDSAAKREFANGERHYLRGLWQGTGIKPWAARALRSLEWRLSAPGLSWSGQTGRNAG